MPKRIDLVVKDVSIVTLPGTDVQEVNLRLQYSGEETLEGEIVQDEELSIEIPSHAPPPED